MAGLKLKIDPTQAKAGAQVVGSALDEVTKDAHEAAKALGFFQDKAGRWREASGRFATVAERVSNGLDGVGKGAGAAARPLQDTQKNSTAASSAFRGLAGNSRLVSMKLSQVAQQGAVTGNYLQALAIQAPDLALGFGAVGIAIGALVPVLYGVGSAMLGVSDEALTSEEAIDSFGAAMDEFQRQSRIAKTGLSELRKEFGEFADEVQRGAEVAAQAALGDAMARFKDIVAPLRAEIDGVAGATKEWRAQIEYVQDLKRQSADIFTIELAEAEMTAAKDAALDLVRALGLSEDELEQLGAAFDRLAAADSMGAVAQASSDALDFIREMYPAASVMPPEIVRIVSGLTDVQTAAAAGTSALGEMGGTITIAADEAAV